MSRTIYLDLLRQYRRKPRRSTLKRAAKARKRMIARNGGRWHEALRSVTGNARGRKALGKFRKFWGLRAPTKIELLEGTKGSTRFLVGMGYSPNVVLAARPNRRGENVKGIKTKKIRGRFAVACDPEGRRIYLIRKKRGAIGKRLRFVGYAAETHYIPNRRVEKAGSFKRGKHWVHSHADEGGRFPKVYRDSSGNFIYGPGTYRIGKWIRS